MKTIRLLILLLAAAIAAPPAGAGQTPQGTGGDGETRMDEPRMQDQGASEEKREEIRKKVEAVRIWRLTEDLKLDADTGARVSSILSSMDQQRRDLMRDQMTAMQELKSALKAPKPDETKLKSAIETFEKNHRAVQELRDKEMKALKAVLTVEQQARYLLFQQEFQREMRGMMSGARGRMGRGPGMDGQMRGGQGPAAAD